MDAWIDGGRVDGWLAGRPDACMDALTHVECTASIDDSIYVAAYTCTWHVHACSGIRYVRGHECIKVLLSAWTRVF